MKNILCLFLLAGAIATQAQTGTNRLFGHIPADADKVYQINLGAINSKISWLSIASLVKDRHLGGQNPMKMGDITAYMNAGVDFHQKFIVTSSNEDNADSIKYTTILIHLTDSGKFAAFLKTQSHGNGQVLHFGKDRVAAEKNKVATWNDHLAVIVAARLPKTEGSAEPSPGLPHKLGRRAVAALHGFSNTYFLTDPRFTTAFSDDADLHIWSRHSGGLGAMTKLLGSKGNNPQLAGLAALAAKASSDPTIGTLRFDNGELTYLSQKIVTPKEQTVGKRILSPALSNDLVAAIPSGQLMGLMAMHYDMPAWVDTFSKMPFAPILTSKLKEKDITLDDFAHALKGSFLVLVYAPDKNHAGSDTGASAKMPVLYLTATVGDKPTFDRLAAAIKISDATSASGETAAVDTSTKHHNPFRYYAIHNGIVVIGANREQVNGFFDHPTGTGASNPASRLLTDRVNSDPFSMAIDTRAFADFLTPLVTKSDSISAKNQALLDALNKIDMLQISSGGYKNDAMETYLVLRFTDQNKNALASLLDIFTDLAKKKNTDGQ